MKRKLLLILAITCFVSLSGAQSETANGDVWLRFTTVPEKIALVTGAMQGWFTAWNVIKDTNGASSPLASLFLNIGSTVGESIDKHSMLAIIASLDNYYAERGNRSNPIVLAIWDLYKPDE